MHVKPITLLDQFESELSALVNSVEVQGPLMGVVFCFLLWNSLIAVVCLLLTGTMWRKVRQWVFWIPMIRAANYLVAALLLCLSNSRVKKLEEELRRAKMGEESNAVRVEVKCPNCGGVGHTLFQCPTKQKCFICKETGHWARDCPKKSIGNGKELNVDVMAAATKEDHYPLMYATAKVKDDNQTCSVLLDTGSAVNVIPMAKAQKWGVPVSTAEPEAKKILFGFNGVYSEVVGTLTQRVRVGPWVASLRFFVIPD